MTDVVIIRWPEEADELPRLSANSVPRLLLVEAGAAAPSEGNCLQDWIRLPASDADVRTRVAALVERSARHASRPEIDEAGRLHHLGQWVALSPIEERLARELVARFGDVVPESELTRLGWPAETPSANAVRVHYTRLRQRLQPLGLELRGVRGHGKLLEAAVDR